MAGAVIKFVPVNDRIILLRFRLRHADLTVIESYAPTEEAVKEEFYYALQAVSFKLTVTVTEMANNWNILNQLTVTVTEIRFVAEM